MARPGVRLGPGERMFAERAVCVGKECVFVFAGGRVCMCVCLCLRSVGAAGKGGQAVTQRSG